MVKSAKLIPQDNLMSPRILLVTTNFWPEPSGTGPYATDLALILKASGYEVQVLTGVPHYPWWEIPLSYKANPSSWMNLEGIQVERQTHFVPRKLNIISRILFEISLIRSLHSAFARINFASYDLVIAIGSSVAGNLVAKRISYRLKTPFGIIVHDLAGYGISQSGLSGGYLIAKIVSRWERLILESAKSVVAISQAMRDAMLRMGIQESKVRIIPIYAANQVIPGNQVVARRKFGWDSNDFIVIHTGNMGAKQDLTNVVRASEAIPTDLRIKIYLVGHGNQEYSLKEMCEDKKNIAVIPAVSGEDYSILLAAADLLLVNERRTQRDMSLPSKLTSYLYSERPVLAAVPREGATWKFLDGVADLIEAGDPIALARRIEELTRQPNKLRELARLGREFAEENLSPESGRKKYLEWVEELLMPM